MPTYEYRCPKGHEFERFQKMTDPARAKCPVCGRNAVRQISGGAGLIFKGSGFYITDYGKDGKGARNQASEKEQESKTETPAKAADASPGKPEEKAKPEKSEKGEKGDKGGKAEKKSSRKKRAS